MPLASRFVRENESLDILEGIRRFISRACISLLRSVARSLPRPPARRVRSAPVDRSIALPSRDSNMVQRVEREKNASSSAASLPTSLLVQREADRVASASRQGATTALIRRTSLHSRSRGCSENAEPTIAPCFPSRPSLAVVPAFATSSHWYTPLVRTFVGTSVRLYPTTTSRVASHASRSANRHHRPFARAWSRPTDIVRWQSAYIVRGHCRTTLPNNASWLSIDNVRPHREN